MIALIVAAAPSRGDAQVAVRVPRYHVPAELPESYLYCDKSDIPVRLDGSIADSILQPLKGSIGFSGGVGDDKGVSSTWAFGVTTGSFDAGGAMEFKYDVPYTLSFTMPGCVWKGEPVYLENVTLTWGTPQLQGRVPRLSFYTTHGLWADFPWDGLDDMYFNFIQDEDSLNVYGAFPVFPGTDSVSYDIMLDGPVFGDGSACIYGVCNKLGGIIESMDSAGSERVTKDAQAITVGTPWVTVEGVWTSTGDQIPFAGDILKNIPTPVTVIIGGVLIGLDWAGFDLETGMNIDYSRRDTVGLRDVSVEYKNIRTLNPNGTVTSEKRSFVTVNPDTPLGDEVTATFRGALTYIANARSEQQFPVDFGVTFDGPGFDRQTIIDKLLVSSGSTLVADYGRRSEFSFGVPVKVLARAAVSPDRDGDTWPDDADNCPNVANVSQQDRDGDEIGDSCDDGDNDGFLDATDNCPLHANHGQDDNDGDGVGDACDEDDDGDGVADAVDNCWATQNADQANLDGDAFGNACDVDDDGDTVPDLADNCPAAPNADQSDNDQDGAGDACDDDDDDDKWLDGEAPRFHRDDGTSYSLLDLRNDLLGERDNCPMAYNPDQANRDQDGLGDACDGDIDSDGVLNPADNCEWLPNSDQVDLDDDGAGDPCDDDMDGDGVVNGADNCARNVNPQQADLDGDRIGNDCDDDVDGDGYANMGDNCEELANPDQANSDTDALGNACDADDDGDAWLDGDDNCPLVPNIEQADNDDDGDGDACDPDDDNDGIADFADDCQWMANAEQANADGDMAGDACDPDDDNDGVLDDPDNCRLVANPNQEDLDGDAVGDACDIDRDGDGVVNVADNCAFSVNPFQEDIDGDLVGDVCDRDIDGDGFANMGDVLPLDNCPYDVNLDQADNDLDGLGNACDLDDDNDGIVDDGDNCAFIANANQADFDGDSFGDLCDGDVDGDLTVNGKDLCAFTPRFAVVDPANGCSVYQLVSCEAQRGTTVPWKNHGQYVSTFAKTASAFLEMGLITAAQKDAMVSGAADSTCGK